MALKDIEVDQQWLVQLPGQHRLDIVKITSVRLPAIGVSLLNFGSNKEQVYHWSTINWADRADLPTDKKLYIGKDEFPAYAFDFIDARDIFTIK